MGTRENVFSYLSYLDVMCCAMFFSMAGGSLQMEKCASTADSKAVFAATSSGQLKMPGLGNFCVTVLGDGMISSDISQGAEATATSSSASHSASNAIDGSAESYWASGLDPATAVSMDLDFGATKIIEKVVIEWEHAPLVPSHLKSWACMCHCVHMAGFRDSNFCRWCVGHDPCDFHQQS